jgi:hemerythrin
MTEKYPWKKEYDIGIEEINNQHKKMLAIINRLYNENEKPDISNEFISSIITELEEYADYHFSTEEYNFMKYDYKGAKQHILIHRQFKRKISMFKEEFERNNNILNELIDFTKNWLIHHILHEDMKYAPYLKSDNNSENS